MEIDVKKLSAVPPIRSKTSVNFQKKKVHKQNNLLASNKRKSTSSIKVDRYLKEVLKMPSTFNRKLHYSVNKELKQVVVKVIDSKTDKVIKIIPSEALLKLDLRMKEVIGIIFDKKI